jgi:hypothetical protein
MVYFAKIRRNGKFIRENFKPGIMHRNHKPLSSVPSQTASEKISTVGEAAN